MELKFNNLLDDGSKQELKSAESEMASYAQMAMTARAVAPRP